MKQLMETNELVKALNVLNRRLLYHIREQRQITYAIDRIEVELHRRAVEALLAVA